MCAGRRTLDHSAVESMTPVSACDTTLTADGASMHARRINPLKHGWAEGQQPKYTKLMLQLDNGTRIAFTDPRRFARIRLLQVRTAGQVVRCACGYCGCAPLVMLHPMVATGA